MRQFSRGDRFLSLVLVLCIGMVGLPALAGPAPAALSGKILRTGTGAPVRDAVLKVALRPGDKIFESGKTDAKGSYSLSGLPAGTYEVVIAADGGVYVVHAPISLQAGERRDLLLSVRPEGAHPESGGERTVASPEGVRAQEEPKPTEPPPPEPPPAEPKPAEPKPETPEQPKEQPPEQPKARKKFYRSAWFGAAVVVGSAVIVGALANSSDEDTTATGSPSEN